MFPNIETVWKTWRLPGCQRYFFWLLEGLQPQGIEISSFSRNYSGKTFPHLMMNLLSSFQFSQHFHLPQYLTDFLLGILMLFQLFFPKFTLICLQEVNNISSFYVNTIEFLISNIFSITFIDSDLFQSCCIKIV